MDTERHPCFGTFRRALPCTKRPQTVQLRLYALKKVFGGSKGRFFKNAPWQGVGQRPTKRGEPAHRGTPFQAGRSPCTKHQQTVRLCLYAPKKVFEGSKGRFFKNAPWQGVGQRPAKRGKASQRGTPFQAGQGPFTKHRQTVRLRLHEPKKVFEGSKGRFFKNAPWQGVGRSPTKGEGEPAIGARLFRRDKDTQGREGGYYTFSFSQRSLSGFTTAE